MDDVEVADKKENISGAMAPTDETHLNSYVHRIIEFIKKEDREYGILEVSSALSISILRNSELVEVLKRNPRVQFTVDSMRFIPVYNIRSVDDLEKVLREKSQREGVEMAKLLESPVNIQPFIQELRDMHKIIILKDMDGSEIVFWNSMQVDPADEEIQRLWSSIKVPNYHDLLEELGAAGLQNTEAQVLRKKKATKKKTAKRSQRRIRLINTHVKGLDLERMNDSD